MMQFESDQFGELHRLLRDQPSIPAVGRPASQRVPQPSKINTLASLGTQPMAVPFTNRVVGRPPLGPDPNRQRTTGGGHSLGDQQVARTWQHNGQYPFLHPLVPRPQGATAPWPLQPHSMPHQAEPRPKALMLLSQGHPHHQVQPQQQVARPAAGGTGTGERRAKRTKPTARKSLQAMFDQAAEDLSSLSFDSSMSMGAQDSQEESEFEADLTFSSQTSGESAFTGVGSAPDMRFHDMRALSKSPAAPGPATPQPRDSLAPGATNAVPLMHFLMSDRASKLTTPEIKAIFYRVVEDLSSFHVVNIIHRHVSLHCVGLTCSDDCAVAHLEAHGNTMKLPPAATVHWGPKLQGTESYAPPEAIHCSGDRCVHSTAGDVWSLGVALFALLAGGHLPFGAHGLSSSTLTGMPHLPDVGVDKLQKWVDRHLKSQFEIITQLSQAQGDSAAHDEMRVLGFDDEARSLVQALLRVDPAQRPSAERTLLHPFFSEVIGRLPCCLPRCPSGSDSLTVLPGMHRSSSMDPSSISETSTMMAQGQVHPAIRSRQTLRRESSVTGPLTSIEGSAEGAKRQQRTSMDRSSAPTPSASGATTATTLPVSCYSVLGHVSRPMEVTLEGGQKVQVSALHAVFQVPGKGAMMSAEPVGYAPMEQN